MPTVILGSNHRDPQPSTSRDANIIPKEQRQSTIDEVIDEVIAQFCLIDSENKSDEDPLHDELHWIPSTGSHLKKFIFDLDHVGVTTQISEDFITKAPYDFFKIFLSDELLDLIVLETNRYARQCKNRVEITTFFGIVRYMGLARLPKMTDYWSKNPLYSNKVSCKMSRNRFELLLRVLHFNDNEIIDKNDRLGKLSPLLENLTNKFKEVYVPEKSVCIDETLVPFRGRLSFRQYIKNKRYKFGIKLYKLCCKDGYTYDIKHGSWVTGFNVHDSNEGRHTVVGAQSTTSSETQVSGVMAVNVLISSRIKTSALNKPQPVLILPFLNTDSEVCVARALIQYLNKTRDLRGSCQILLITSKKPYRRASPQTISSWIKNVLEKSGVNINQFKPLSTRHAATSLAARAGIKITSQWTSLNDFNILPKI
ncbi:unnamed protein product [Acanthoscelides obtectus]|uniref:PiggyBac transposable element-derived protein domain-containing protein n=1 Tax=Acanthoscelides obtectus TaxID=200917 RepID=A0A9P0MGD3_ACAOB|nr:unnamed protein product [Acanthoscelides obtectus]CAK1657240.1 PiggyBac transposable element-derived protein 4 [Acanthoscelides obtectus]